MDAKQVKTFIGIAAKNWKIKKTSSLFDLIDLLYGAEKDGQACYNGFEVSIAEGERSIRILHLYFLKEGMGSKTITEGVLARQSRVRSAIRKLSHGYKCGYNTKLLDKFLDFNNKKGLWQVQFGLEYRNSQKPKVKVYLSLGDKRKGYNAKFPLKEFCENFGLDAAEVKKITGGKDLDTVAIDLLDGRDHSFKFYPYDGKDKGCLCRISASSERGSRKIWQRFPEGLLYEKYKDDVRLPEFVVRFIKRNGLKAHYLCRENGKKSVYFR